MDGPPPRITAGTPFFSAEQKKKPRKGHFFWTALCKLACKSDGQEKMGARSALFLLFNAARRRQKGS
jgi:hypothetical protein